MGLQFHEKYFFNKCTTKVNVNFWLKNEVRGFSILKNKNDNFELEIFEGFIL